MGGFVTKLGNFATNTGQATQYTGQLAGHASTFYGQYNQLRGRTGTPQVPYQQPMQPTYVGRDENKWVPELDTEEFDVEGSDESGFSSWLAIGIVIAVVILLVILVRFARSERLVSNSPQLLSHENVELREYSYYVPKLKLPYMFF